MKKLMFFGLLVFIGCTSQSLEDIKLDCNKNPINVTVGITNADCGSANGSVAASVTGGQEPFRFDLGNGPQNDNIFSGLAAGNYTLTVTDANNCQEVSEFIILSNSGITASATATIAGCGTNLGTITITAANGLEPYTFKLNDGNPQSENVFDGVGAGMQRITIADANGCEFILDQLVLAGTSYTSEVGPIIMNNCAVTGCHSGSQSPNFSTFSNVQANAERIKSRTQSGSMPPGGRTLTNEQIQLIACWVDDGAKDN
jgi:hypothetical protein